MGLGLVRLHEFVQRGWRGELLSGDRQNRGRTTPVTVGKSDGSEQLNHKRPNQIGKGGLASEVLRRRSQMANIRLGIGTPSFWFRRGKSDVFADAEIVSAET